MRIRRFRLPAPNTWRVAVLLVAVSLLLYACNGSANLEMLDGAQVLPDEHIAAQLIAEDATDEEVADAAFTCHQ